MTTEINQRNRQLLTKFRSALYDYDEANLTKELNSVFLPDCPIHLAYPFETLDGPEVFLEKAYKPLVKAIPDLERRDYIVMAGDVHDTHWVGCAGFYSGVFEQPWLDIPPTQQVVSMRFHEFFRIEDERIVEVQALWDIPELMIQAGAWPMTPSLGVEWLVPGPATQDGVLAESYDESKATASTQLVANMLDALSQFAEGGVEAMTLENYWHPKMMWYGPAGIGTSRRISGFRYWHQIPFLNAMPDRIGSQAKGYLFGDGDYVGFTAWPGMHATISGDGWLGIAPSNQKVTMRSLDFWRCENGLIRENWVLVDILDVYHQIGVDVFARMRELTHHRQYSALKV